MSKKRKPTQNLSLIAFADLKAIYDFLKEDYIRSANEAKSITRNKLLEVEEEIYERLYGYNIQHEHGSVSLVKAEGVKPETIDLSKFDTKEDTDAQG